MKSNIVVLHAIYQLADYPVLAAVARDRTMATRLDGRACQSIYESVSARIDWSTVSASELAFMQSLGIKSPS